MGSSWAREKLLGAEAAERCVRPNRVVVDPPGFDQLACIGEIVKPVLIEALVA